MPPLQLFRDADDENSCGATATQWCVSASYFGVGGQFSGPLKPVEGSAVINIHYKVTGTCSGVVVDYSLPFICLAPNQSSYLGSNRHCQWSCDFYAPESRWSPAQRRLGDWNGVPVELPWNHRYSAVHQHRDHSRQGRPIVQKHIGQGCRSSGERSINC